MPTYQVVETFEGQLPSVISVDAESPIDAIIKSVEEDGLLEDDIDNYRAMLQEDLKEVYPNRWEAGNAAFSVSVELMLDEEEVDQPEEEEEESYSPPYGSRPSRRQEIDEVKRMLDLQTHNKIRLLRLAMILDQKGFTKEAEAIDGLFKKAISIEPMPTWETEVEDDGATFYIYGDYTIADLPNGTDTIPGQVYQVMHSSPTGYIGAIADYRDLKDAKAFVEEEVREEAPPGRGDAYNAGESFEVY